MSTEADSCGKFVVPKHYAAGWNDEQICEQRQFTDGRIMISGSKVWRKSLKRDNRIRQQELAFFQLLAPEAREILNDLLEKYATDGEHQFTLPDVIKLPPISQHGNVNEIIGIIGGAKQLRQAASKLQTLLYVNKGI
jgi:hypothetical protein